MRILLTALIASAAWAGQNKPAAAPVPFANETLSYTINWPSGLSLGEGRMTANRSGEEWRFGLALDASIPGFTLTDTFASLAAGEFCSREFVKKSTHGKRKTDEKTTFEPDRRIATRETTGGGKSEISIEACPRDALAFLYYVRRELSHGRVPPPQTVYYGAAYQVRLEYGGAQAIRVNDKPYTADRIMTTFKGPASNFTFEMFFARDAVRTPLVIKVPLMLGTFSMELAP
ncbi:MAG TPA: DUF3108 domain-containing protein [Bryobacteraceae bacterium]|nr:DUF3108 domain-containing protein [Bryobacteraceae bacterium]